MDFFLQKIRADAISKDWKFELFSQNNLAEFKTEKDLNKSVRICFGTAT